MKCKNCGTDIRQDDLFCPDCGVRLTEATFGDSDRATNTVADAFDRAFSSMQFMISCIFLSVAVFGQVFLMKDSLSFDDENSLVLLVHIMPVLCLVFLWMLFSNAKSSTIKYNTTPFKVFTILPKIQIITTWVAVGAYVLLCLISMSLTENVENLEPLLKVTKLFVLSLFAGSMYNILIFAVGFLLGCNIFLDTSSTIDLINSICSDNGTFLLLFVGAFMVIANIYITKNLDKCAYSLSESLSTGRPTFEKTGFAKIALFIMGGVFILPIILIDGAESSALITYGAYGGFMISMGLTMNVIDNELTKVNS